jgi:hypothetical protein
VYLQRDELGYPVALYVTGKELAQLREMIPREVASCVPWRGLEVRLIPELQPQPKRRWWQRFNDWLRQA